MKWTLTTNDRLRKLSRTHTVHQIADELGCTKSAVYHQAGKLHLDLIKPRMARYSSEVVEKFAKLHHDGVPLKIISVQIGVGLNTLYRWLR